jgi:hypothetical protein
MITNPPEMPTGYRIGDLRGNKAQDIYYGMSFLSETSGGLYLIDTATLTMSPVVLPTDSAPVAYEFSPDGQYFFIVQASGDFVKLNAATGAVLSRKLSLVAPTTNLSNHGQFEPGIAAGLGRIYVTDPINACVLEIDMTTLKTLRRFEIPGTPTKVTLHGVLETPTR